VAAAIADFAASDGLGDTLGCTAPTPSQGLMPPSLAPPPSVLQASPPPPPSAQTQAQVSPRLAQGCMPSRSAQQRAALRSTQQTPPCSAQAPAQQDLPPSAQAQARARRARRRAAHHRAPNDGALLEVLFGTEPPESLDEGALLKALLALGGTAPAGRRTRRHRASAVAGLDTAIIGAAALGVAGLASAAALGAVPGIGLAAPGAGLHARHSA